MFHVAHPDGEAKFWLQPTIELAKHSGLSARQIGEAQRIVDAHVVEITDAWHKYFSG
jgi:hypothetical protein